MQYHNLSQSEVAQLAVKFAGKLQNTDVIAISGDLGAGKTFFTKNIIAGLGGNPDEVTSPTFTIMQQYHTPIATIYHYDWYRLQNANEIDNLGFTELIDDSISIIEWPEIGTHYLPEKLWHIKIEICTDANFRNIKILS